MPSLRWSANISLAGGLARGIPLWRSLHVLLGTALAFGIALSASTAAHAQAMPTTLELTFVPTDRAQIAVWLERDDGLFLGTLALTHAVAKAGIGNRPGALQMNSGFRWPYGRREGVLPVWAHRRANAPGAAPWKRVIFQNRRSEGFASRNTSDHSADEYYCLSFQESSSSRDELDAVTCPSVFSSDKGRFVRPSDEGYSEPFEAEDAPDSRRTLSATSLYPPRRDVDRCGSSGCFDHPDVAEFKRHALEVMPELDAVTQATPQGLRRATWQFELSPDLDPDHGYTLFMEVNVEGDYNAHFDPSSYPTPTRPADAWDSWAQTYGYPYRGQPSMVYALPFRLEDSQQKAVEPVGYGDLHGLSGELSALDDRITNDPMGAPGSGADRLRIVQEARLSLDVIRCQERGPGASQPEAVQALRVEPHPDRLRSHMWARLSFRTPESAAPVVQYDVRVKQEGGDWERAFMPDAAQELLPVALDMCAPDDGSMGNRCEGLPAGSDLSIDLAGLRQNTRYQVSVRPRLGGCGGSGPETTVEFSTPGRAFATVSPCFVATAAYGSPLSREIGVLRRFRDRYLAPHALGRIVIDTYYRVGPDLAEMMRERPWLRKLARSALTPLVSWMSWWLS